MTPRLIAPRIDDVGQVVVGDPKQSMQAGRTPRQPRRDTLALGIAAAAIILFVGTGGQVVPQVIDSLAGGVRPDSLMVSALLLNVALILFGWQRYRQMTQAISQHRSAEAEALRLAEIDHLTGFLNRRSLDDAAAALLAECEPRGESLTYLMLDLDNFKNINDFHGHVAGDTVLKECARRIAELLPKRALAARIGGDEFACLVPSSRGNPERVDQLAAALIESVASPIDIGGSSLEATISIGLASSDNAPVLDGDSAVAQSLHHAADIAMYHAKKQGRNRYYWFEASMENELRFRREVEAGIRQGLANGEFVPFYEQQIDLKTGKLVGFEMLARWNSPMFGLVSPETFIPVAEEIGAIGEMSQQLIARALQDAKAWDPELTLSVNISPVQLRDPWFAQKLLKLLVEANFPPKRLEIEITESCLHENVGVVRTLIASLKNQGVRITLDDFGTGYSSIGQLRSLPFDSIKIDRSFVTNLTENNDSETIIKAITALGEGLGLPITAEGIENPDILTKLKHFGEFRGQGYLYGKPETAAATELRLAGLNLLQRPGEPPDGQGVKPKSKSKAAA
ncbi:MAG: putative bifunctional diguanylate cyclase/phosphodiesterase [Novosphingobium sp.]